MTGPRSTLPTRLGKPGGGNYPFFLDDWSMEFVVYAANMNEALFLFKAHKRSDCDPWLIRQMSDNE
jgi:hypothetical protein